MLPLARERHSSFSDVAVAAKLVAMHDYSIESLICRWVTGRSIARNLPPPVAEHGGYKVEINSDVEIRRWVFPRIGPGLRALAREIDQPRVFLRVADTAAALRAAIPPHWQVHDPSYLMATDRPSPVRQLAPGYVLDVSRNDAVTTVRIMTGTGQLAARGHAAETADTFVYDQIVTEPEHQRRGLGGVVMATLAQAKRNPDALDLLVATADGRALYESLGWAVLSPYASASIPAD